MNYILVDCFDTLFHRYDSNECTLFMWAKEMSFLLNNIISSNYLYRTRKHVERNLIKQLGIENPAYEVLMENVYDCLPQVHSIIDKVTFVKDSYDLDCIAESRQLYLDEDTVELLKRKKNAGNSINLVSDFYLPRSFFEDLLQKHSIRNMFDELFISSDIGLRKSTGNLYKYIIDFYSSLPQTFLMIGDDSYSDGVMAEKHGIKVFQRSWDKTICPRINEKKLEKKIKEELEIDSEKEFFKGFCSAILLFCERLYDSVSSTDCKTLLFCSREGQFLKRIFDYYQNELYLKKRFATEYLYISRRATLLPSLGDFQTETFERIFRQYNEISVTDFLLSVGFSSDEINKFDIPLNKIIHVSSVNDDLRELRGCSDLLSLYDEKRTIQKRLIQEYIREKNNGETNLYLVDIGWKGTIQDNLFFALDGNYCITGYYFGTYGYTSWNGNQKIGLMFDENVDMQFNGIFTHNHIKLETVLAADHYPVKGYDVDNGHICICFDEKGGYKLLRIIKPYQEELETVIHRVIALIKNSPYRIRDMETFFECMYLKFQCIEMPKYREVMEKLIQSNPENFGNISGRQEKVPQNYTGIHRRISRKFLYSNAAYITLKQHGLSILYPLASTYCHAVYCLKYLQYYRQKKENENY